MFTTINNARTVKSSKTYFTANGTKVAHTRIEYARRWTSPEGVYTVKKEYITLVGYNEVASVIENLSAKDRLTVSGTVQYRKWVTRGGEKKEGVFLFAKRIEFQEGIVPSNKNGMVSKVRLTAVGEPESDGSKTMRRMMYWEQYVKKDENEEDGWKTEFEKHFITVVAFKDEVQEDIAYMPKGDRVLATLRLSEHDYKDKHGVNRRVLNAVALQTEPIDN